MTSREKKIDIIVALGICILFIILTRGIYNYGMEYDEVYRCNNIFQHFSDEVTPTSQAISSLRIGDVQIPLMLKQYISYATIIPWLGVAFFEDSFIALRTFYVVYAIISTMILYFAIKKYDKKTAMLSVGLLITCPMLYPYLKFGWATILYAVPLCIFVICIKKYFETLKSKWVFFATFAMTFFANIQFYFIWVVAAVVFAMIVLYPKRFFCECLKIKNLIAIISASILGLLNFVVYNIVDGFPTIKTLWNYLFKLDEYNKTAIDGKSTSSLWHSLGIKWNSYTECIGNAADIYVIILVTVLLIYIVILLYELKNKSFQSNKKVFLPLVVTMFIFLLMFISPNAQGSHHLCYGLVTLNVAIAICFRWLMEKINIKYIIAIPITFIIVCFCYCNYKINISNEDNGSRYFSNQIFEMIEYTEANERITDENLIFVEWGFAAQFYFMNKGEFTSKDYTFQLIGKDEEQLTSSFDYIIGSIQDNGYYIPCYVFGTDVTTGVELVDKYNTSHIFNVSSVVAELIEYLNENDIQYETEQIFYEEGGEPGMFILRVLNDE